MSKVAYLDCPTGIAGDMFLGALVDAGVPLEYLIERLKSLGFEQEYQLNAQKVHRMGQIATKVSVNLASEHSSTHRHLPDIQRAIQNATLPPRARDWSLQVFQNLAIAEGAVHGISPEKVHFHEVGAVDAIVDIVGSCLGLDWLGIDCLYCSAFPTGGGRVKAAHGLLPVPVPAVLKLWETRNVPIYSNGIECELVTPTGAAIAVTLAQSFGSPPPLHLERIGLGAGSKELPIPNILRLWIGESGENARALPNNTETIAILETQIDDLNPQAIGYTFDALFEAGAVDVFTQAIGMKKSRPGILLTVLCPPNRIAACQTILFRETTTLGIRYRTQQRAILNRTLQAVDTPYGTVRVKVATQGETLLNIQPEYEDCATLARENNQPWRVVHRMALDAWHRRNEEP
ncbi:nickel pincer cofactor biosynthesis protein LarC [Lusitaniella coriacea LEGE 07157]|uniref:Putative nickel insertion protein n=1 Tax=Lusitaniella coriacea LEGE 07157 TaxID=945747 RepID=A0A8J7AP45_9CYAN|nr:nickel pincer cofactor biosynthesis protein LarC [Lusitaniella coriacea]MBE9115338.1 nickel pincer cofactor biosynthesis protein LarC [Lusitaniella coriacea LEGE 07157]